MQYQRIYQHSNMSRIRTASLTLKGIVASALQSPRCTVDAGLAAVQNACHRTIHTFDAPVIPSAFQVALRSITQYPFVTVIEKHEHSHPDSFVSRKQGTEWQPY